MPGSSAAAAPWAFMRVSVTWMWGQYTGIAKRSSCSERPMSASNTAQLNGTWTPEKIEKRVRELGTWFHNMNLRGVQTAPNHFLGDYPTVKWLGFADAVPKDLTGKSVLDIGCNAGFYAMEMKRR